MLVRDLPGALIQGLAVDAQGQQFQSDAVQDQRTVMVAVAPHLQPRLHLGRRRLQGELQIHRIHQEGGRTVVGQVDRLGGFGAHAGHVAPPLRAANHGRAAPRT